MVLPLESKNSRTKLPSKQTPRVPGSPLPPHRGSRDAKSIVGIAKTVGIVSWNNRRPIGRRGRVREQTFLIPDIDCSLPSGNPRASTKCGGVGWGERSEGEKKGVLRARAVCVSRSITFIPCHLSPHSPLAFNTTHGCNRFLSRVVPSPRSFLSRRPAVLSPCPFIPSSTSSLSS